MAVQDQLRTEGGIAAHADRHMTPFPIHDVKVVMLDERPLLAVADFGDLQKFVDALSVLVTPADAKSTYKA